MPIRGGDENGIDFSLGKNFQLYYFVNYYKAVKGQNLNETHLTQNIHNHWYTPSLPCSIVQGADWHWGPSATATITEGSSGQPKYIRICALVTCVLSFVFLIAYLVYQVSTFSVVLA